MCRVASLFDVYYNYSPQIYRSTLAAKLRRPNGRPSWPRSSKLPTRTSRKMLRPAWSLYAARWNMALTHTLGITERRVD
ncbi:hypothetical protein GB937_006377 [Aspergillus fischeri]|nr:hypothetical protein GB937_006377 [Aspergillus fischeri]